jgi:predicted metal-dependent HD superfamily phosphohydrolase
MRQWAQAVRALGGVPAETDLVERYGEPHRKYHNATHVEAVLSEAALLADLPADDNAVLTLAICAHDVIYDARPGEDERASAQWARDRLIEAGVPSRHIARVEALVLATIKHESDDELAHILLDADLSILGAEPADYDRYVSAVRQEYSFVPEDAWRQGRAAVLGNLLDRKDLFQTTKARARWDEQARANLRRELTHLS